MNKEEEQYVIKLVKKYGYVFFLEERIEKLERNINKLINYIAVRENKDYEDIRKEFDI